MSSQDESVDFDQRGLVRLLGRHVAALALCALIGLLLAAAMTLAQGKQYTSSAQIEIGPPLTLDTLLGSSTTAARTNSTADAGTVAAQADILRGEDQKRRVEQLLRPGHPGYSSNVSFQATSNVVGVTVTSRDRRTAQDVATAYTTSYLNYVADSNKQLIGAARDQLTKSLNDLNQRIDDLSKPLQNASSSTLAQVEAQVGASRDALVQRSVDLQTQLSQVQLTEVASPSGQTRLASPASSPVASRSLAPLGLGLVAGLLVGLAIAALREATDGRVLDEEDVTSTVNAPLLADLRVSVPRQLSRNPFADDGEDDESYRALAASLWPQHRGTDGRKIWMLSGSTRDGAAAVILAVRLARQLARLGRKVAVVGIDSWPNRTAGSPGLAEVVRGEQHLAQTVLSYESGRILVLTKGQETTTQAALANPNFSPVLKQIADEVDVVLFVGSPLLASADPLMLAPLCDGVILAVERRVTRRRTLSLIGRRLERLPIDSALGGVVLQGGRRRSRGGGTGKAQLVAPTDQVVTSQNRARSSSVRPVQPLAATALFAAVRARF